MMHPGGTVAISTPPADWERTMIISFLSRNLCMVCYYILVCCTLCVAVATEENCWRAVETFGSILILYSCCRTVYYDLG